MEPLVFAILQALTPKGIETDFYDDRIEPIPFDTPTDAVVLSISTFTAQRAYQIAHHFKNRGIPVIAGGFHPTLCPDETARFVDCVVTGDAEDTWPSIVEDLKSGQLRPRYSSLLSPLPDTYPDRSLFKRGKYIPVLPVQFGRGCPYQCDFCSIHAFYGASLRQRTIESIELELNNLHGAHIFFTDDNLLLNRQALETLLDLLAEMGRKWSCQISLDAAEQPELLKKMAKAGCTTATIGFESLDTGNLRQMGKRVNETCHDYSRAVRNFNEHGIMVYGCFVFGYDFDTPDVFPRTLDFVLENNLYLANFIPLTPMPGTTLYQRLLKEERLINDPWWLDPGYRYGKTVFRPRGMSPEELEDGILTLRTEFNRYRSMARRLLRNRSHLRSLYNASAFLATNIASRREVKRKHHLALYAENDPFPEVPVP